MKIRLLLLVSVICIAAFSFGCYSDTEKKVKDMLSHKFDFCGYSMCLESESKQVYTIVSYIDSIGCVECKIGFNNWKRLKAKIENENRNVRICFIVHPSASREMDFLLRDSPFHPDELFVDYENKIRDANEIPKTFQLQTFLISNDNDIVLVGNPSQNPNIEKLLFEKIEEVAQ